jgi:hypothetical protein
MQNISDAITCDATHLRSKALLMQSSSDATIIHRCSSDAITRGANHSDHRSLLKVKLKFQIAMNMQHARCMLARVAAASQGSAIMGSVQFHHQANWASITASAGVFAMCRTHVCVSGIYPGSVPGSLWT